MSAVLLSPSQHGIRCHNLPPLIEDQSNRDGTNIGFWRAPLQQPFQPDGKSVGRNTDTLARNPSKGMTCIDRTINSNKSTISYTKDTLTMISCTLFQYQSWRKKTKTHRRHRQHIYLPKPAVLICPVKLDPEDMLRSGSKHQMASLLVTYSSVTPKN